MTKSIRKSNKLLLSFVKPYKPISTSALSKWCVSTLQQAGVDITVFRSHSTRSASTSHSQRKGLFIKQINKAAGWSFVQTFAGFYRKPIEEEHFSKVVFECKFGEYSRRMLNTCTSKYKVSFPTLFYKIC